MGEVRATSQVPESLPPRAPVTVSRGKQGTDGGKNSGRPSSEVNVITKDNNQERTFVSATPAQ